MNLLNGVSFFFPPPPVDLARKKEQKVRTKDMTEGCHNALFLAGFSAPAALALGLAAGIINLWKRVF